MKHTFYLKDATFFGFFVAALSNVPYFCKEAGFFPPQFHLKSCCFENVFLRLLMFGFLYKGTVLEGKQCTRNMQRKQDKNVSWWRAVKGIFVRNSTWGGKCQIGITLKVEGGWFPPPLPETLDPT